MSAIGGWNPPGKIRYCSQCGLEEDKLPQGTTMMLCTGCRFMTYCSAACQKRGWSSHKAFCRTQQLSHARTEERALSNPIKARAEGEAIEFGALVLPEVSEALYNANRVRTSTPLTFSHNVVLHFAYDPSQPTLRRRFVFQSGKILPRAQVKAYVVPIIGYWTPVWDTALLPSDIVKKFSFKAGELPSVVLNLFTPLPHHPTLPPSARESNSSSNLHPRPAWAFHTLQPLGFYPIPPEKMLLAKPLVDDWERVLRLTLSGDQPKDADAIEDFWLVESGTARAHMEQVRRLFGDEAYQNEVRILAPLLLKKEAEERAERPADSSRGGSAPRKN